MNDQQILITILQERGYEWAIDMISPKSAAPVYYHNAIHNLDTYLKENSLGTFSVNGLISLLEKHPFKGDAFLQALVSIRSTNILCAAWRIIQGMEIRSIDMHYVRLESFSIKIELLSPYGGIESYDSTDINDAVFLRHLGKSRISEKPLFDGFYALRQKVDA